MQIAEEAEEYSRRITELTEAAEAQVEERRALGVYADDRAYQNARNYAGIVVDYDNGNLPPTLDDVNCSGQGQLGLYVRK